MATTTLTYTDLDVNGSAEMPAGTALVASPTNDMKIADARPEETVLVVSNTDDTDPVTITVHAGDTPPAMAGVLGDLEVEVEKQTTVLIGPFESGRVMRADGSMLITADGTTGTIAALRVKRH